MRRRLLQVDDHDVVACLNGVASCLESLDRSEEALPRYEEAIKINRRVLPPGHPEALRAQIGMLEESVRLYDAWDKPAKAAEWRAKLPDEVNSNEQDD